MPNPKIFISHSAKEDRTRRFLDALARALAGEGFEVLLDLIRLQPNDTWREKILRWPWQCHASVILFSKATLESRWVKTEAGLLVSRRNLSLQYGGPAFEVLPVYFDPETPRQLADPASGFEPLAIPEIQAVTVEKDDAAADAAAVARIVERLRPLRERFGDLAPFGTLRGALVAVFDKSVTAQYRESIIEQLAAKLGAKLDDCEPGGDRWLWMAGKVLRADFDRLYAAVQVAGVYLGRDNASWLCKAVAPFCWVDEGAAARIPEVLSRPAGPRAVGLNSRNPATAAQYLSRALADYPPQWELKQYEGGGGGDQPEELVRSLRANVKAFLRYQPDEEVDDAELNEELDDLFARGRPLFLLVPPPVPDREVIERALAAFPHVVLLLLTGDLGSDEFRELDLPGVEFLLPELDERGERRAERQYEMLVGLVNKIETP